MKRLLFLSYRLAERYPESKASKIILQFTTPWPKQSYQHVTDVKAKYSDSNSAVARSISIVAIFLLTNLLSVPLAAQDMIVHMCMTAGVGYTLLLHIQLYQIYPVLVIVPTMFIGFIIHFYYTASKKQDAINHAKLMKMKKNEKSEADEKEDEEKEENEGDEEDGENDFVEAVPEEKNQEVGFRKRQGRETLPPHEAILEHTTRRQSMIRGFQISSQLKATIREAKKGNPDDGIILFQSESFSELSSPSEDGVGDQLVKDDDQYDSDWMNEFSELTLSGEDEDDASLEIPLHKPISSEANSSSYLWQDQQTNKSASKQAKLIN